MISRTFVYISASLLATAGMIIFGATQAIAPATNNQLPLPVFLH